MIDPVDPLSPSPASAREPAHARDTRQHTPAPETTRRREQPHANEEALRAANRALQAKVDELSQRCGDLQHLINATALAIVFLDRELRITHYTPPAVQLFHFIPSDVGRPLSDLTPRLHYPELAADAAGVLDALAPTEREVGRADGRWFLARILPYHLPDERVGGVVLSFIDITDRKRAEQVSQWLSAVVASSIDAIISFSLDGHILSWNGAAERIFGRTAGEMIGQPMTRLDELIGHAMMADLLQPIARGQSVRHRATLPRGAAADSSPREEIHVALVGSPIADAGGAVLGGMVTARDVSDARRAEEALRRSEERLRLVIENARDFAIFSTDTELRITSWNSGAQRLLGYSEAEALGLSAEIIFTDEDRAAGAPRREAATARAHERAADDRFHLRKDGSRFWGSGALMRMDDGSGGLVGFVKILRDQTDSRESQAALQRSQTDLLLALRQNERAREVLESTDKAKDRFIAVLSHELRNPLASVSNAAALLNDPARPESERMRAAQIVARQARTMKALVDDLLDVSRLAVGELTLHLAEVPLTALVDAALETARPIIEASHHQLQVILPHVPVTLHVDPLRISQALVNLLTNAAKFTPPGGDIALDVSVQGPDAVMVVSDNGVGMDGDTIGRIFELYEQGPSGRRGGTSGLGVGLALVRSIVLLHGGQVDAWSDGPGRGSRFRLRMPMTHDVAAPAMPASASQPVRVGPSDILLVDDNADAAWALGRQLGAAGHRVRTATSGLEALDLVSTHRFDFAVLDIGMPGMDGIELARRIRARPEGRAIRLVALTGWDGGASGLQLADVGFDAHLTKPIGCDELLASLARLSSQSDSSRV